MIVQANLEITIASIETTLIPITQGCFVPILNEIGPVVLEKKILADVCLLFCCYLLSLGIGHFS